MAMRRWAARSWCSSRSSTRLPRSPRTSAGSRSPRACARLRAITANRARNNIQESLRDLGANTPYGTPRRTARLIPNLVDPRSRPSSSRRRSGCRPLAGWKFKLGTGIVGRPTSASGARSRASPAPTTTHDHHASSAPLHEPVPRAASTPRMLAGATTIELTEEQRRQSSSGQGCGSRAACPGTPITGDPNVYAFAALRCATDNLNGDNVEWIAYPTGGVNHVFCFAYYVTPAPTSGTIIVRSRSSPTRRTLPGADVPVHRQHLVRRETSRRPTVFDLKAGQRQSATRCRSSGGGHRAGPSRRSAAPGSCRHPDLHVDAGGRRRRQRDHRDRTRGRRGARSRRHGPLHVRQHRTAAADRPARLRKVTLGSVGDVPLRRGRGRAVRLQPHDQTLVEDVAYDAPPVTGSPRATTT